MFIILGILVIMDGVRIAIDWVLAVLNYFVQLIHWSVSLASRSPRPSCWLNSNYFTRVIYLGRSSGLLDLIRLGMLRIATVFIVGCSSGLSSSCGSLVKLKVI
jgi:hypothetical protein